MVIIRIKKGLSADLIFKIFPLPMIQQFRSDKAPCGDKYQVTFLREIKRSRCASYRKSRKSKQPRFHADFVFSDNRFLTACSFTCRYSV